MNLEYINPGKKTKEIVKREDQLFSKVATRSYILSLENGKGPFLWDADGKKYLDFGAGVAVASSGHRNPWVSKAVKKQSNKIFHIGYADFHSSLPVEFAEELNTVTPKGLNTFFYSNSGTEAVEAAYKCARWHTKKRWVIAFENCFHGRTMGSLSMTNSKPVQRERYNPFLSVKHAKFAYCYRCPWKQEYGKCDFSCVSHLDKLILGMNKKTAALFMEPIQGEGGYIVPPREFVKGVRKLCTKYDILYCDDEVQAGYFRTGKFLAVSNFDVKPDIISMGKGIGHGLPIGVTISSKKIMDWVSGAHSNTFGGNLIACAGALAGLKYMKKYKIEENVVNIGFYFKTRLLELYEKYEIIGDVRGIGLMLGIELVKNRKTKEPAILERNKIVVESAKRGLILLPTGKSVIRFCPPLIINKNHVDTAITLLGDVLRCLNY